MTEIESTLDPFVEAEVKELNASLIRQMVAVGIIICVMLMLVDCMGQRFGLSALPLRVQFLLELFDSLLPLRLLIWCKRGDAGAGIGGLGSSINCPICLGGQD